MLALRKTRPAFGAELVDMDFADEALAPGEVEVAVHAAGLCGSDLHAYAWTPSYGFMTPLLPLTIGHEFAGVVRRVAADVTRIAVGDRVTCWPTMTCGTCDGCRRGRPEACEARRIVGLHADGGFAERVRLPAATLHKLPDGLDFDRAALCEPLAIAVNAVDHADIAPGCRVVVLGPGPIGAAAAWVAQHRGADVLLLGLDDAPRLEVARGMGVARCADLRDTDLAQACAEAFGGGPDRVIEATGVAASVSDAVRVLRPEGIVVAAGIHDTPCTVDLARLVREKKQLRGVHDTTADGFAHALDLLVQHGAVLERLITHRLPLRQGLDAFDHARGKTAMKVMMYPNDTGETVL
ncbi:sorbitol dehydrogenase (plasmid) [Pacificitalea manganoxidans]|uniref:Sorbitol dehydrogenase n=1 Tax=Pacificitalea manganoxidans TaxID=1411902 RepID=A0A291M4R4_9RHOB|nr:alcohol dehydrogenase catalytic domain-containing protein [Pacificitalea manganoxidans]ATI43837.1 sorbitol dehydrogenase [Pacificitalea manganoxidans]MDR6310266.1 L-iditol 2-dehydrogenase [Pacificitalea manganoxidans]